MQFRCFESHRKNINHENHKNQLWLLFHIVKSCQKNISEILRLVRVASHDFYVDIINNCSCLMTNLQYPVLVDVIWTHDAQIYRGGHGGFDLLENNNYLLVKKK